MKRREIKARKIIGSTVMLIASITISSGANAALYNIYWTGANGYSMQGQFGFSDTLLGSSDVQASKLTSFSFSVYGGSTVLGSWNAFTNGVAAGYSFNFNFDATTSHFLTGGGSSTSTGQDWNVVTGGSRCPSTSIGFSSGSYGQAVCVNGQVIVGSMVLVKNSTLGVNPFIAPTPATQTTPPAVPLPPTAWMLGSGLLGLAGASRKRKTPR